MAEFAVALGAKLDAKRPSAQAPEAKPANAQEATKQQAATDAKSTKARGTSRASAPAIHLPAQAQVQVGTRTEGNQDGRLILARPRLHAREVSVLLSVIAFFVNTLWIR